MAYTARDFLEFIYPIIWQQWSTRAVGSRWFLRIINMALDELYGYKWFSWSWQHRADAFTFRSSDQPLTVRTRYPIRSMDKFWTGNFVGPVNWIVWSGICDDCAWLAGWPVYEPCDNYCCSNCQQIIFKEKRAHNKLCAGEYSIDRSTVMDMWGAGGWRHISLLAPWIEQIYVTYFCGVMHLKSYEDIIPLPDCFMRILAMLVCAYIIPHYGQSMQWQETSYRIEAQKNLEWEKENDKMSPDTLDFIAPNGII